MLDDVLSLLRCPVCRAALTRRDRALRCDAGHSYDIARPGYVSLFARRPPAGDTAAMVAAREAFLAAGHYRWLTDLLACRARGGVVVDAGAGTGHHLAALLDRLPAVGIALDSSGYALRRAARAHERIGAVRADLWRPLPVRDAVAGLVVNVFAPRNGAEFRRILTPDGRLLTVTPTRRHLAELVDRLGLLSVDRDKPHRLTGSLGEWFTAEADEEHDVRLRLDTAEVAELVAMGPSAWHTDPEALRARLSLLSSPATATASCRFTLWRPR